MGVASAEGSRALVTERQGGGAVVKKRQPAGNRTESVARNQSGKGKGLRDSSRKGLQKDGEKPHKQLSGSQKPHHRVGTYGPKKKKEKKKNVVSSREEMGLNKIGGRVVHGNARGRDEFGKSKCHRTKEEGR